MQEFHFETVDSTNEAAKRLLAEGCLRGPAYVWAREQTAGKGTRGRTWISPRDAGLYLSVIDVPDGRPWPVDTAFTLAAGVACAEAIEAVTGLVIQLKPVNDLVLDGCKLGGILTETVVQNGCMEALITGIGLNLRRAERPVLPPSLKPASLEEMLSPERFARLQPIELIQVMVAKVRRWNGVVSAGRLAEVMRSWERRQCGACRKEA